MTRKRRMALMGDEGDNGRDTAIGGGDIRPVPDPTRLTTANLNLAITALREILETRLDGMDKAIELLQTTTDRVPARIDEKIGALHDVNEEKFHSIQQQFVERDARTEQTSKDSKLAVDAALQAAKEAVAEQNRSSALAIAKSETATVKQIDQQGLLIQTATKALDDKIDDIKSRLTRIEGKGEGVERAVGTSHASTSLWIAGLGLALGTVMGIIGFVATLWSRIVP